MSLTLTFAVTILLYMFHMYSCHIQPAFHHHYCVTSQVYKTFKLCTAAFWPYCYDTYTAQNILHKENSIIAVLIQEYIRKKYAYFIFASNTGWLKEKHQRIINPLTFHSQKLIDINGPESGANLAWKVS